MLRASSRSILGAVFITLFSVNAGAALLAPGIIVETNAEYNNGISGPTTVIGGVPGSVDHVSRAGPGGSGVGFQGVPGQTALETFDEAIARGRASLPGTLGSYSHAGGFSPSFPPGPGSEVSAAAEARTISHWVALTAAPGVTSVDVDVLAFYDGSLLTSDFAGATAGSLKTAVTADLRASNASGQTIYEFKAEASLENGFGLTTTGTTAWRDAFEFSANGANEQASFDYVEVFNDVFTVQIGEVFAWESGLGTSASVPGAFELFAVADFLNTGDGTLSVDTPGVTLVQVSSVPLPASLPLLIGALALLRKRCYKTG